MTLPCRHSRSATFVAAALPLALLMISAGSATPGSPPGQAVEPSPATLEASVWAHLEWRNIGPAGVGGRIVDFAAAPDNPDVIYVGTAYSGAWKTINGGVTWAPIFERENRTAVGGIAVAPSNPNIVWIGSGEANGRNLVSTSWGDGVYKSEDGGKSWTNMGLPHSEQIGRIRIHPDDADTVYVSVLGSLYHHDAERNAARGLWRTTDGGGSWEKIVSAGEHGGFVDLELDPRDPDLMYAASWQRERVDWSWLSRGDESGLWRSTDGGESWRKVGNGLPQTDVGRVGVSVCRNDPDVVYSIFEGPEGGVFRSDDRGASWERRNTQVRGSQYYAQIRCDPNDPDTVYTPQTQFLVSHDGGRTFANEMAGKPVHVDHHALWIDPDNSNRLVLGNDGGIYLSRDRGDSWQFVHLPITQYYEIGVGMQEPFYYVCGGTQDNNSHCAPSGTRNAAGIVDDDWFVTTGGDGFYAQTDPSDSTIVYSESQNGGIIRLDTLTGERKRIKPADPQDLRSGDEEGGPNAIDEFRWNWSAPILISKWDPATIYFGAQALLRSPNRGDTWEIISPDLTRALVYENPMNDFGTIRLIAESPVREGLLAVGTDDGLVQVTQDGGATWSMTEAMPGVPEMALVRRLVLSAHDAETVYAASSSHEYGDFTPYVSKSTDLGRTWVSITGNLPDGSPVRAFAEHPGNPDVLFVGTEHGVWATVDGGVNWVSLKNNLPTVAIHDIVVHPRDNDLVIGTHGRGIWILDNINPIEGLSDEVLARPAHVFHTRPAAQFNTFNRGRGNRGTTYFSAPNPPRGVILDVWVAPSALGTGEQAARPQLTIHDQSGAVVRRVQLPLGPDAGGLHRLVWNMRYDPTWVAPAGEGGGGGGFGGGQGTVQSPWVLPGRYEARLTVGDAMSAQPIEIVGDPLAPISETDRLLWHDLQVSLSHILATARAASTTAGVIDDVLAQTGEAIETGSVNREYPEDVLERVRRATADVAELRRELGRVTGGAGSVYNALRGSTTRPTDEQLRLAEVAYEQLGPQLETIQSLLEQELPVISGLLDGLGAPWTMGRPVTLPDAARPPRRR
jgi:photosystem II stability/assembly factor-like uncharacterized protein